MATWRNELDPSLEQSLRSEISALRDQLAEVKADLGHALTELSQYERCFNGTYLYPTWTGVHAPRVSYDQNNEPYLWHITLNRYQRTNLLWLMCDLMGYSKGTATMAGGIPPFNFAATGDWAGEIPNMLRFDHNEPLNPLPNMTAEAIQQYVKSWMDKHYGR